MHVPLVCTQPPDHELSSSGSLSSAKFDAFLVPGPQVLRAASTQIARARLLPRVGAVMRLPLYSVL